MTPDQKMPPDLKVVTKELRNEIFATMNCIQIGKIEKVTPAEQTVEITLQIKRAAADGTSTAIPLLVDCPYIVIQGGGAYLDMPIKAGDYCVVLFNDRDIDTWWATANMTDPASTRKHSLSDGIALVGVNAKPNALDMDGEFVRILGTSGPGTEAEAGRKGDAVQVTAKTDPAFYAWLAAVGTATGAGAPPASITGKITGGSSGVKIG